MDENENGTPECKSLNCFTDKIYLNLYETDLFFIIKQMYIVINSNVSKLFKSQNNSNRHAEACFFSPMKTVFDQKII